MVLICVCTRKKMFAIPKEYRDSKQEYRDMHIIAGIAQP